MGGDSSSARTPAIKSRRATSPSTGATEQRDPDLDIGELAEVTSGRDAAD